MKTIKLLLAILLISSFSYGQDVHLNYNTVSLCQNDSVVLQLIDNNSQTHNTEISEVVWYVCQYSLCDTINDTVLTIYSDNAHLYKSTFNDSMFIFVSWLDHNGNPFTDSCIVSLNTTTSIIDYEPEKLIHNYKGYGFNITEHQTYQFTIYDINGRMLFNTNDPTLFYSSEQVQLCVYVLFYNGYRQSGKFISNLN